jgi:hypothetical protein
LYSPSSRPRQRPALDVQSRVATVHVLVDRADRDVVVDAVLDAGAKAELLVERQIGGALALRYGRAVEAAAERPQPAVGKHVLCPEREAPGVVIVEVDRFVADVGVGDRHVGFAERAPVLPHQVAHDRPAIVELVVAAEHDLLRHREPEIDPAREEPPIVLQQLKTRPQILGGRGGP